MIGLIGDCFSKIKVKIDILKMSDKYLSIF